MTCHFEITSDTFVWGTRHSLLVLEKAPNLNQASVKKATDNMMDKLPIRLYFFYLLQNIQCYKMSVLISLLKVNNRIYIAAIVLITCICFSLRVFRKRNPLSLTLSPQIQDTLCVLVEL